jgi:hypothetical protein
MVIDSKTEDVEYLKKILELNDKQFEELGCHLPITDLTSNKIKSLINKYKEQEKVIELMLIDLSDNAFYMDDNEQYCEVKHKECDGKEYVPCKNCLLEYYEKKAR